MNLYQDCITVNWPFGKDNILVFGGEDVRMTDEFIRHVETQANWSLNLPFQRRYPELRNVCEFVDLRPPGMSSSVGRRSR